jgi:hypothetical protein
MYDEETLTLWNQQTGTPVAGPGYARTLDGESPGDGSDDAERDGESVSLDFRPVTQTTWDEWRADHPDSEVLSPDTGYDLDYAFYRDYDGFVKRHYWENDDVFHPGVRAAASALDDRTYVYGVDAADGLHAYPVDAVREHWPVVDEVDGRRVVAVPLDDDVAVYDAPDGPLERGTVDADGSDGRDGDAVLVDADGRRLRPTHDALVSDAEAGGDARTHGDRVSGRHGLWLAFRPHYETVHVVDGTDSESARAAGAEGER